uniref:Uncharacterized protein n=1 Tax=Meloidogyne incognita TaxID=6306 RepID=A0A914KFK1_MELIC
MSKEVKNGKTKLVAGNIIRMGDGRKLSEKFYEHVNIGAYLHNYTGMWTLGLDMLPTTGQKILNLFVYKGCACGMEAWFKMPTTPPSLAPEIIYRKPAAYEGYDWGKLYHDKDCKIRHTPKTTYPLGNITDGELLIQFTIWTGTMGKDAIVEVFNGGESIIKLYTTQTMITHTFKGKLVRGVRQRVNLLGIGASFTATLRLTKYYVWSKFSSNQRGSEHSVFKYWSDKWWNGQLFKGKGSNTLKMFGDFVTVTPVITRTLTYEDIKNMSKAYKHVVDGQIFDIETIYNENVTFRFRCKYPGLTIEIRLISNRKPILSWHTITDAIETEDYTVSI